MGTVRNFSIAKNPELNQHIKARVGYFTGAMREILVPLGSGPVTAETIHATHAAFCRLVNPSAPITLTIAPGKTGTLGAAVNSATFALYPRTITLHVAPAELAADRINTGALYMLGHEWMHVDQTLPTHLAAIVPNHERLHTLAGKIATHAAMASLLADTAQQDIPALIQEAIEVIHPGFGKLTKLEPIAPAYRPTTGTLAELLYSASMVAWINHMGEDAATSAHERTAVMHRERFKQVQYGAMIAPSNFAESEAWVLTKFLEAPTEDTPIETVHVGSWCEWKVAIPEDMRTPRMAAGLGARN